MRTESLYSHLASLIRRRLLASACKNVNFPRVGLLSSRRGKSSHPLLSLESGMTDKKSQGRSNRRKGGVVERALVKMHLEAGVEAKRVPLSGAAKGFKGDLLVSDQLVAEAKSRKGGAGFATLERWLGENDILFLHRNRAEPLAVMPMSLYMKMVKAMLEKKGSEE